jgi:hypothetical protein
MMSLGSALALAPPWQTALLLIPSNGVCKRARTLSILLRWMCWCVCAQKMTMTKTMTTA